MTTCARGGYLVDAKSTLPADATVIYVAGLPVVGCTRLRCGRCRAAVRNAPGLGFRTRADVPGDELSALYDRADWSTSALLAPTQPHYRLCLCRCSRWLESGAHACEDPDPDLLVDPQVPWRCSGHPTIVLPHDIDGIPVRSLDELRELAARGFKGFAPPATTRPEDADRGYWLARLRARVDAPAQAVLDNVASARLEDSDPHTRALAVMYAYSTDSEACAHRVLELLEGDRTLYRDVPDNVTPNPADRTLEESMWRALRPHLKTSERIRDAMRAEALSGRAGRSVFPQSPSPSPSQRIAVRNAARTKLASPPFSMPIS